MKTFTIFLVLIFLQFGLSAQITNKRTIESQKAKQTTDTLKNRTLKTRQILPANQRTVVPKPVDKTNVSQQKAEEQTLPEEQLTEEQVSVETSTPVLITGDFSDARDGHTYHWVKIGEQVWMSENLAWLPSVSSGNEGSIREPYYYVYDFHSNDVSSAKATESFQKYGVLYNWNAALTACPTGWHLPADLEWKQLEKQLGMADEVIETPNWRGEPVGALLKSVAGWNNPGNGNEGTNESGFSAVPGGLWSTYNGGSFDNAGFLGFYWTATAIPKQSATDIPMHAWYRSFAGAFNKVNYYVNAMSMGKSVRCLKD